jgi:hypothetical protein
MRGLRIGAVALSLCLVGTARAGVYNPAEPEWPLPERFEQFLGSVLTPLRQFGTGEGDSTVHERYALLAGVAARAPQAALTADQRLALSGYLIREAKYREAIEVLAPILRDPRERDNFLLLANLATAWFLDGRQPQRGADYLAGALEAWPRDWKELSKERREWLEDLGWNEAKFQWYRRAETYLLKLFRLRLQERALPGASPLGAEIETLFDDGARPRRPVRFVGESGKYEAGKLKKTEAAKLPPDAVPIVEQLLIWLPQDVRLYWLLGELLNARGEYATAGEIFAWVDQKLQASVKTGFETTVKGGSRKARRQLTPAPKVRPLASRRIKEFARLPEPHKQHLAVLLDKVKADEAAAAVPPPPVVEKPAKAAAAVPRKPGGPSAATGGPLPIDLRSLLVGFVAGLMVMIFALWQLREIRRRLHGRSAAPRADSQLAHSPGTGPQEGRPG